MWLIILFAVLAIGFFTTFLIVFIINGGSVDMNVAFSSIILPAMVFTGILGALGLMRTKQIVKYVNQSAERFEKYKNLIDELVANSTQEKIEE